MSIVTIAKKPNLSFITTSKRKNDINNCQLPLILKQNGSFDWDANAYLTKCGGGPKVYNLAPLATTIVKKAYNLNIFCSFLEENLIIINEIDDSTLYQFVEHIKDRLITDTTIISHVRLVLDYIVHLTKNYPGWNLSTPEKYTDDEYAVHYTVMTYKFGGTEKEYLYHRCLDGLIHISTEAEFIHDNEYVKWLDAINCSTYHPEINDFFVSRWQAFSTLLEVTGSRITEAHQITRTMIKQASKNLMDSDAKHVIRNIPVNKGKYKGKTRQVQTTKEDLQIILWHINLVENMFPDIKHDSIFVNSETGAQLKSSYLKNYAKKVINNSPYKRDLRHIVNHSFRHRFITLHVAKAIRKMAASGSFSSILNVAATACRKITMHASNSTLSHYVHLASELNHQSNQLEDALLEVSSHIRMRVMNMLHISESFKANQINNNEALEALLSNIEKLRKLQIE